MFIGCKSTVMDREEESPNANMVCMNRSKMSPNRVKCDGVQKTPPRVGEMEMSEQVMCLLVMMSAVLYWK